MERVLDPKQEETAGSLPVSSTAHPLSLNLLITLQPEGLVRLIINTSHCTKSDPNSDLREALFYPTQTLSPWPVRLTPGPWPPLTVYTSLVLSQGLCTNKGSPLECSPRFFTYLALVIQDTPACFLVIQSQLRPPSLWWYTTGFLSSVVPCAHYLMFSRWRRDS